MLLEIGVLNQLYEIAMMKMVDEYSGTYSIHIHTQALCQRSLVRGLGCA